jgi:DNA-binding SARP family transcriptional activator
MQDTAAALPSSSRSTTFEVLGPVTVTVDGVPARLGGPRQVAVLARLLVNPGQVVSMDQLVDAVWDGDAPARPEVALRSYVSNLRRAVEPGRDRRTTASCIESRAQGYRLAIDPESVDAHRFERLISTAGSSPPADASTLDLVSEAIQLWRGEPYEGMADSDAITAARSRLEELRLVAVEIMAEAKLGLGHHETVIAELDRALATNPLRERLTELMMLALYRAGRQSEALAVCNQLRKRLLDGQGIDPGRPVQELEHKILVHDQSLEGPRTAPAGPATAPPGPSPHPTIVGRDAELRALAPIGDLLAQSRSASAVITGEPGSGKSLMARHLVGELEGGGACATWGRCRPLGRDQALWPWGQLLDGLESAVVASGALDGLQGLVAIAPALAAEQTVGNGIAIAGPTTTAEAASYFQPIVELLKRVTRQHPLVIVIEDAHWADEASIELLAYAGAALADYPVGFVVTWRPTDLAENPVRGALRQLARLPNLIRVELAGLGAPEVEQLVVSIDPEARPASSAINRASAGNPMLVCELAAGLGALPSPGADGEPPLVPTLNLRDAMLDRIEHTHGSAFDLLAVGALLGSPFSADIIAKTAERPSELVEEVLDRAVGAGLLVPGEQGDRDYGFRHPITAVVLADELGQPRRSRIHAALGHALWRQGRQVAEIVHQFSQADTPATSVLAARFAVRSVATTVDPTELRTTAEVVGRGLSQLTGLDDNVELRIRFCLFLVQWARLCGDQTGAEELASSLVEAAEQTGQGRHLMRALVAATGPDVAGPSWAILDRDPPIRLLDGLTARAEAALAVHGDEALAPVLSLRTSPDHEFSEPSGPGRLALRRERARWAIEHGTSGQRAATLGPGGAGSTPMPSPYDRVLGLRLGMISALEQHDVEALDTIGEELDALSRGDPSLVWLDALSSGASLDLYRGRLESARLRLESARRHCHRWGLATTSLDRQALLIETGTPGSRPGGLIDRAGPTWNREEQVLDTLPGPRLDRLAGEALAALRSRRLGRPEEATRALEALTAAGRTLITMDGGLVLLGPASLFAARAALTVGDLDLVRDLLDQSEDHARVVGSIPTLVRVLLVRAELGRADHDPAQVESSLLEAKRLNAVVGSRRAGVPTG